MRARAALHRLAAGILILALMTAAGCAPMPAEETWALQDTFDPLEDPIFDILSNALAHDAAVPVQPGSRDSLVPFSQMVYTRPDADAIEKELYDIAKAVASSGDSPGAAVLLLKEAGELWDGYLTALNLALIHHDINTADAYWADEYAYCAAAEAPLRMALAHVQGSAAALQGEETTDASTFDQDQYVELLGTEQTLISEYNDLLYNAFTIVDERQIYYADGLPYADALAWLEAFAPRLSEIYAELVRTRNAIARCFGYANYAEYALQDNGYSTAMVQTLLDALSAYYAPLYSPELDAYRDPALQIEASQAIAFMRTIFSGLDPSLTESLDLLEAYQLSSLAQSADKAPGAFTTYLADYGVPFICMSYDGTYNSFATLLHEFGHFNDLYRNEAALYESSEISEIFSTALVLLCSDRYGQVMDAQQAAECRYRELCEILMTSLEQGALLRLELEAYTMPESELTAERLSTAAQAAWQDMGLPESPVSQYAWMQTPHLYETPFYVLSYIVSGGAAMQVWELAGQDAAAGFAKYNELLAAAEDENAGFLDIVAGCGLASPFSVAEVARQADVLSVQLSVRPEQDALPQDALPQDAPPQDAPPQDAPPQDAPPQALPAAA